MDEKNYSYSAKNFRQELKKRGAFYTPPEMAEYMRKLLPDDVDEIYDPTCGNGGLLSVYGDDVQKYGQELESEQLEVAKERLTNFHGANGDTLANPAFMDRKFRYIIANPPFSVKWEQKNDERFSESPALPPKSKADYAFILHCIYMLAEDGKAVIMGFPGILYRGQSEGKIRRWICEKNLIEKVIAIPGKKFEDTQIPTCILVLNKAKNTTDIVFRDEDNGIEKTVKMSEILANDFNLSPNTYIEIKTEKEEINPVEMNRNVMKCSLRTLESDIENTFNFAGIFPDDFPFLPWYVDEIFSLAEFAKQKLNEWRGRK